MQVAAKRSGWPRWAAAASVLLAVSAQATTIYTGTMTIASTDPTQLGRLSRNAIPQTWGGAEAYPGLTATTTSFHYRTLDLDLDALEAGFVYGKYLQIIIDSSTTNTFLGAFLNTYTPTSSATVQSTWLGDPGSSGLSFGTDPLAFQVVVNSGNHLILVLNETSATANAGVGLPANIIVEAYSDDTFTDLVAIVPEPASWALMGCGMAAIGLLRRRRQD